MRKVKIITIILAIILITLVAFGGVYIKTQNRMENKVKDYQFSRELEGGRVIELNVANINNEDEKLRPNPEDLTEENYKTVKETIEKRLKYLNAEDYTISLNKENGTIRIELAEDNNTDTYVYYLTADGKVQIKEKDTETELLSDAMVKKALYSYNADPEGSYEVFLELYLTDEGQAKIEEIKNNYAIFADEVKEIEDAQKKAEEEKKKAEENAEGATDESLEVTTEDSTENQAETRKIAKLTIAGNEYDVQKIEKNKVRVIIGSKAQNTAYVNRYISSAAEMAMLINSGKYPVEYEIIDNRYEYSDITKEQILYFAIAIAIIILISFIILIIKYKTRGLLASISFVGFVAIISLLLRYTNVNISIEGIGAIVLILIINFIVNKTMLDNAKETDYKKLLLNLIPVVIITLVFSFTRLSNLSSFGMIMFWGLALIVVYNLLITDTLLKLKESK